jgi:hypothetical protein
MARRKCGWSTSPERRAISGSRGSGRELRTAALVYSPREEKTRVTRITAGTANSANFFCCFPFAGSAVPAGPARPCRFFHGETAFSGLATFRRRMQRNRMTRLPLFAIAAAMIGAALPQQPPVRTLAVDLAIGGADEARTRRGRGARRLHHSVNPGCRLRPDWPRLHHGPQGQRGPGLRQHRQVRLSVRPAGRRTR